LLRASLAYINTRQPAAWAPRLALCGDRPGATRRPAGAPVGSL